MSGKKLSDLTTSDVTRFIIKVLVGFVIFYGIILLIGWLANL